MFEYSEQFGVQYLDDVVKENSITDSNVLNISSQLFNYVKTCNDLRNDYVKKNNNGENANVSEYLETAKNYHYTSFGINEVDLKKIRNKYLHWSANLDSFGMEPRISGVKKSSERKRTILDG